jgi:hypothetical protein
MGSRGKFEVKKQEANQINSQKSPHPTATIVKGPSEFAGD